MALEEKELKIAGFLAKPRQILDTDDTCDFNGCRVKTRKDEVIVTQKGQGAKLALVSNGTDQAQQFIEQRARGAYITSIYQPEATYDYYSIAAQVQAPTPDDINKINKRIQWQIDNAQRGLRYVPLDLATAKLMIFTDGSFANNSDLTSQIGFVIALVNEQRNDDKVAICGNLLHWSSTKCKRVTRSVLASEISGLATGFDLGYVLAHTLQTITARLKLPVIPIVICTDSYSLYECLVKLGSKIEKRLMIDIMSLRQSYERREIDEVRWIDGDSNPADAMTKASPNKALERLVSTNKLTMRLSGWVQRTDQEGRKHD